MKQKANFFTDNDDVLFHFNQTVPWDEIVPLLEDRFSDPEGFASVEEAVGVYEQTLNLVGEFSGTEVAARARAVDEEGVAFEGGEVYLSAAMQQNLNRAKELGMLAVTLPRKYGGWNFPVTIGAMMLEILSRACVSTMIQTAFYAGPARLILRYGSEAIRQRYLPKMCSGDWSGAIAMTESEAGSDVGKIRTVAVPRNGKWLISGQKQFITNGGAEVAVVLARSDPPSSGLEGLSLFVVPKYVQRGGHQQENFFVSRLEHKVCIHGSPTCELMFDESEGELLGEENRGFQEILAFTNEARIGVGIQSLGLAQAAHSTALEYAQQRVTMGKPIIEHELVAEMLLEMELQIKGLRSLIYEASSCGDKLEGLERKLNALAPDRAEAQQLKRERDRLMRYLRELTPLIKYYAAEKCIEITRAALQVHGGYGVITDYDAERFYRDAVVFPIYEGTSQIQALMALKDTMKDVLSDLPAFFKQVLRSSVRRFTAPEPLERKLASAEYQLYSSIAYLLRQTLTDAMRVTDRETMSPGFFVSLKETMKAHPDVFAYAKLHAERLTIIKALVHISRVLLREAALSDERRRLAERFIRKMEPLAKLQAAYVKSGDRSTLTYCSHSRPE
ncbi:MAG: acyl-CoA dehydrogenase family protein [Acidobacteria bacterium]|nr:acyl-CoA dehydrogenase family protein [Acidobacteriota bacterium]